MDEGIHAMAERKLRLDAAVLDGVTAAGVAKAGSTAAETAQVPFPIQQQLLTSLFAPSQLHLKRHTNDTACFWQCGANIYIRKVIPQSENLHRAGLCTCAAFLEELK